MHKGLYFGLLIFMNVSISNAQNAGGIGYGSGVNDFRNISSLTSGTWIQSNTVANEVKGSQFLFEDWKTTSIITTKDDKNFKLPNLNYDARLDQMVAKISADSLYAFNPAGISQVMINNKIFKRYLDPELGRNSFYEVIANGKNLELLKRNNKVVQEGIFNPMTQSKQSPDTYILAKKYFIKKGDKLTELALKKGKIMKLFSDKSDLVKNYIREHKLSVKEEVDLQKIFIYYDSL